MGKMLVAMAAAAILWQVPAEAAHYITVDVDGVGDTALLAINAKGQIAGYANGSGFFREADGTIVPFQVTGYANPVPWAINNRGDMAGSATYSCGEFDCEVGFLRLADGTVTTFFASNVPDDSTQVMALNAKGQIAGSYLDPGGSAHGFIRQRDGKIRTVDVPGAEWTELYALNDDGYAAGFFRDATATHGLLVAPDGAQTAFDVPGAQTTLVNGLNDDGTIVGFSIHDGDFQTGYLRSPDGTITTIDGASMSQAIAIDRSGNVAGYYQPVNRGFAFLRRPSGEFMTFRPRGSKSTDAHAIGDHGTVVGSYEEEVDGVGKTYGFIWRP
ncbi:MAG TPA: hypothetical protein VFV07_07930 [Rhizomicrobium sp.]|nr:hypothetical protein [Rhizomicrobium sp.]